jgi:hypothetical protein
MQATVSRLRSPDQGSEHAHCRHPSRKRTHGSVAGVALATIGSIGATPNAETQNNT